jgi:hypothetical protein
MTGVFQQPAKPIVETVLPAYPVALAECVCPTCGVCDWMIRPDGTMSCYHCLVHLAITKNWCPRCGQMRG